mmetsp:Transcript_21124/g.42586  ORF Transcript_21124/g.42586 Transcript_21124/m.42586 type:complete len:237 (-) Transcript_21124:159-869(-)
MHPPIFFFLLSRRRSLILLLAVREGDAVSVNLGLLPRHPHGREGAELLHIFRDVRHLDLARGLGHGHDGAGQLSRGPGLLGRRIAVLGLGKALAREHDQLGPVLLQALHVRGHGALGPVGPAGIDGDADGAGVRGGESGGPDLLDGESAPEPRPGAVLLGGTADDGTELLDGTGGDEGGLGGALEAAGLLLGGLVEGELGLEGSAGGEVVLLVAVDVGYDVVVLHHLDSLIFGRGG